MISKLLKIYNPLLTRVLWVTPFQISHYECQQKSNDSERKQWGASLALLCSFHISKISVQAIDSGYTDSTGQPFWETFPLSVSRFQELCFLLRTNLGSFFPVNGHCPPWSNFPSTSSFLFNGFTKWLEHFS